MDEMAKAATRMASILRRSLGPKRLGRRCFFLLKSDGFPKGTPQKHNYTKKKQHSMETIWQEIPPPRKEKNRMGDFDKGSDRFWEKCPKVRWGIFYQQAAVN